MNETAHCPVLTETTLVLLNARQLARSVRRLRRSMKTCNNCVDQDTCPVLSEFNEKFTTALTEVMEEWGIGVHVI